ncbi:MAG: hypothetical protein BWX86_02292 [Verrucomicrobia bacterium ADurb.Bin122]|nr:MAG: hypothetical protein BWX86_02292 [Verrucomicrobia bacterium ADurb.Bin122]
MRRDLRAVAKRLVRPDHRRHRKLHSGHVPQQLIHLPLFPEQLLGMIQMLVLAATAAPVERAARRHPVRRRRQHLDQIRLGEILVVAKHPRAHALARQRKRHHHHPAAGLPVRRHFARIGRRFHRVGLRLRQRHAPEPRPEIGQRGNLQLDLLVIGEGTVVELFLFGHAPQHTGNRPERKTKFAPPPVPALTPRLVSRRRGASIHRVPCLPRKSPVCKTRA